MKTLKTRVPPELVKELNNRFPLKSPSLKESEREIFHYAGMRYLIEFLESQVEEQSEDILERRNT